MIKRNVYKQELDHSFVIFIVVTGLPDALNNKILFMRVKSRFDPIERTIFSVRPASYTIG